jgi:hypothetical protein
MRRVPFRAVLPFVWTLLLAYGVERLANYYFLGRDPAFYLISGWRLEVFIFAFLAGSAAAGAFLRGFRPALATQLASLLSLLAAVYVFCDPRVCYATAPDGLEPLRLGLFLGSVAVAGSAIGAAAKGGELQTRFEVAAVGASGFVAVAWYPVVFAFAGARMLVPLDPLATAVLLFVLAVSISARGEPKLGRLSLIVPPLSLALVFGVAAGIAWGYIGGLAYDVLLFASFATLGGGAGAALAMSGRGLVKRARRATPAFTASALVLVLVMTLLVVPDAVNGVIPGPAIGDFAIGVPVYSGAYMNSPQGHAYGVGVTVSFKGTNASAVEQDNFLSAGIGVHSAGCCVDGIDYSYRADAYLFHSGEASLVAQGWEACDDNVACGGHSWKLLLFTQTEELGGFDPSQNVTLRMVWSGGDIIWSYSIGGGGFSNLTAYEVPPPENHDFNTGVSVGGSILQNASYFYQFGVMSAYPISRGGWSVTFGCPATLAVGVWTCVEHARSLIGEDSYWKVIWRWGEDYPGVSVVRVGGQTAVFSSTPGGSLQNQKSLW